MELKFLIIVTKSASEEVKGGEKKKCAAAQKNSYFPIPDANREMQVLICLLKI